MKINHYLTAGFLFFLVAAIIACPATTFAASVRGLDLWWNIVFPAQLPFFIAAELLAGLGAVHCLGVLLEPLMRPVFRVPGVGGFVLAVSLASGFPMGAMLSTEYRQQKALSQEEGERLLSLASTAGPLYMTGAVATGMLGWPEIGLSIIAVHYLSALTTAFLMRFHKRKATISLPVPHQKAIFTRAIKALVAARRKDGRDIPKLLNEATVKGFNSLMLVGGFIVIFSIITDLLETTGLIAWVASLASLRPEIIRLIAAGLLEITGGCRLVAQGALSTPGKIIAISVILAWNGLSVQGQAASFVSQSDLSMKPYVFARAIQACFAAIYAAFLFRLGWVPSLPTATITWPAVSLGTRYLLSLTGLAGTLAGLAVLSIAIAALYSLPRPKLNFFKVNQPRS